MKMTAEFDVEVWIKNTCPKLRDKILEYLKGV
jgi:hypothetical protein